MPAAVLQRESQQPNIYARVPDEIKQHWQRAAAMRGQTLTDFIIFAANAATAEIFEQEEKIELTERDQMKLAKMLLNPPEANEAMKKILMEYKP